MFDLKLVSLKFLDNIAKTPITIKVPSRREIDPTTMKTQSTYDEYQAFAFVRQMSIDTVSHSNNYLTQNARQVIFKADDIPITSDSLILLDGVEYKIKQLIIRNGYYIVVVDEK